MKAPINFAQKIKGHEIKVGVRRYVLGNSMGVNNQLWIYPQTPTKARNVINIHFDWSKERYVINIAKSGDGVNFHTTLKAWKLNPKNFTSFNNFLWWLENKLPIWEEHFEF